MLRIFVILSIGLFTLLPIFSFAQNKKLEADQNVIAPVSDQFYDSLKVKAYKRGFTRFIYKSLVSDRGTEPDAFQQKYNSLKNLNGKIIASINVKALEVFGPSFSDPDRRSELQIERWANNLHIKTSLKIIHKNIILKVGDEFDVDKMLDNERIIRSLPYIKDVRFLVSEKKENPRQVDILVLTKDVFSFGFDGKLRGLKSVEVEMSNQNIWGLGHQISARMVNHSEKEPYVGFEGYYTINNIGGNFIDFTVGYANTYKREGVGVSIDKQFIRTTTKFGGGASYFRLTRADRILFDDPVRTDFPLDYRYIDFWSGYAFQLKKNTPENRQLVLSGRVQSYEFFARPEPDLQNDQYFANSNFYMASLSLSKRKYVRDYLIYSYGITEDIPKGSLHEIVVGYDDNEFYDRWYTHAYFSTGNFIRYKPSYLHASLGVGGFFNSKRFEQGQVQLKANYISRLFKIGRQRGRQFVKLNYILGVRRYDLEKLYLRYDVGIRGFQSNEAFGKQRLSLNLESVFFQERKVLRFNVAFFGFADLGIIGSNRKVIFNQDYYAGFGAGIRLRNESLVFKTLQLRLAYYPGHPADIGGLGVIFTERSQSEFFDFQARKPKAFRFE